LNVGKEALIPLARHNVTHAAGVAGGQARGIAGVDEFAVR